MIHIGTEHNVNLMDEETKLSIRKYKYRVIGFSKT